MHAYKKQQSNTEYNLHKYFLNTDDKYKTYSQQGSKWTNPHGCT